MPSSLPKERKKERERERQGGFPLAFIPSERKQERKKESKKERKKERERESLSIGAGSVAAFLVVEIRVLRAGGGAARLRLAGRLLCHNSLLSLSLSLPLSLSLFLQPLCHRGVLKWGGGAGREVLDFEEFLGPKGLCRPKLSKYELSQRFRRGPRRPPHFLLLIFLPGNGSTTANPPEGAPVREESAGRSDLSL